MKKTLSVTYMLCGLMFTTCLIVANIIEQKLIHIGPVEATAGLLIFPVSYILNDVIAEIWGYRKARLIIWGGFAMNFLAVFFFQLSIWAPGSEHFTHQEAYTMVLGSTLRITLASFVAFLCGSFVNAYVMSRMKLRDQGRHFSWRAIVSTLFGEGCDSLVFFHLAFLGLVPYPAIIKLVLTQTLMKTCYEILVLPLTNLVVNKLKNWEQTDTYDHEISYNPFKIRDL
ncbi:MAG: queuosine precursor transporter [Bacteroidales bacterium]|nr:queuosine precursor transporter [Bacteroidales bacterium]